MARIRWGMWVVALAVALAACDGSDPSAPDPDDPATPDEANDDDDAPLRIGFIGELSGPFAIWGVPARDGMRLAVEELNADGGIAGRQVELVERDTQGVPEEGVTALRELAERREVVAAGGLISSDVALAVARAAEEEQVPLFLVMAGSDRILSSDSRMTFRTCLPSASMIVEPLAAYIATEDITRVAAVVADYEWGRAVEDAIEDRLRDVDGLALEVAVAPVQEREFTSYLRRFQDLDPQLIIATSHPPGALPLTRQAAELGMDALVAGSNSPAAAVVSEVGDAAYDRFLDLACAAFDDPSYHALAARYHDRFDAFMEDAAVAGYGQILMLADAIEATGTTDPQAITDHLRSNRFDLPGYAWPLAFTDNGDLADAEPLLTILRRADPPEGVNPGADWYPEVVFRSPPLTAPGP